MRALLTQVSDYSLCLGCRFIYLLLELSSPDLWSVFFHMLANPPLIIMLKNCIFSLSLSLALKDIKRNVVSYSQEKLNAA